jgi:sulfate adenylyltransferase subunit 1 (EFTu-like GTPase family)
MNDIDLSDYSDEILEQLLEEYNLLACQSNDAELYKQSILIQNELNERLKLK